MNYYQTQKAVQSNPTQRDYVHIQSFKNGNPRALDEFYLRHQREFLKWAEKVFGLDAAEALDVYQDAIIILYENIQHDKLNQLSASLKTYFFAIGKNLILKKLARRKSEMKRWQNAMKEEEHTQVPDFENLPDQEQTKFEAVVFALEGLSERNQSILRLYYYHKLPLKDIAIELGYESADVVKNQKVRCMKYLRKLLETQMEEVYAY
jgi:RNA polymerase sigma-70 factor (ECF subfamily)